jgi:Protein of unknown function (DUF1588)/Protein of unknown function (DUF1592)/Protein of unknown function (DUF1595)/Protein of unknown function (DUF1585)
MWMMPPDARYGCLLALALGALSGLGCEDSQEDLELLEGKPGPGASDGSRPAGLGGKVQPGAPMLRNLSNREYFNVVSDLLGADLPFEWQKNWTATTQFSGFDAVPWSNLDTKAVRDRTDTLEAILDRATVSPKVMGCTVSSMTELAYEGCAKRILEPFATRGFSRPLTEVERGSLTRAYEGAITLAKTALMDPTAIFQDGIRVALGTILFAPQFLTRTEVPSAPDFQGRRTLSSYELANRVAFMLIGSIPDEPLWASAQSGALSADRAVLAKQVDRLLTERSGAFVNNFMGQWFDFRAFESATFESLEYAMWHETSRTLAAIVDENLPISALVKPGFTFINDKMAAHYGIPGAFTPYFQRIATEERGGILQQGSWLSLSATALKTSPIHRGRLVQDRLLCKTIPPPDSELFAKIQAVSASIPNTASVKERLDAHRKAGEACFGCHQYMDPIGLGLEGFDPQGKVRTIYADTKRPVETDSTFLGKPFSKVTELNQALADMPEYERCAAEKLVVFGLRRTVNANSPADTDLLNYLSERTSDRLTIRTLVMRLVASDAFLAVVHGGEK